MRTQLHRPTPSSLRRLAAALRRGELVALPTETVYGLAADALSARACRKIFTAKRRPANDPLIVHVTGLRAAEALAEFNPIARALARHFWPGPLTLVLPKKAVVPALVTSGQDTVALRAPAHPLARRLLRLAGIPLAAPSANPFGYVSPTTAAHVLDGLRGRIPHVLDGGACAVGVESTIVAVEPDGRLRLLRPGAVTPREILACLRSAGLRGYFTRKAGAKPVLAPGLLSQHYSPHTPLLIQRRRSRGAPDPTIAYVLWRRPAGPTTRNLFWLTETGSPDEAARRLYATLRRVDALGFRLMQV